MKNQKFLVRILKTNEIINVIREDNKYVTVKEPKRTFTDDDIDFNTLHFIPLGRDRIVVDKQYNETAKFGLKYNNTFGEQKHNMPDLSLNRVLKWHPNASITELSEVIKEQFEKHGVPFYIREFLTVMKFDRVFYYNKIPIYIERKKSMDDFEFNTKYVLGKSYKSINPK